MGYMIKTIRYHAGVELDMKIAQEFLGYKVIPASSDPKNFTDQYDLVISNDGTIRLPRYSQNDSHAFKLLKKFRDAGDCCCLNIGSDYNYLWSIKLTLGYGLDKDEEDEHKPFLSLESESFALIVCNAILEVVEFKKSI